VVSKGAVVRVPRPLYDLGGRKSFSDQMQAVVPSQVMLLQIVSVVVSSLVGDCFGCTVDPVSDGSFGEVDDVAVGVLDAADCLELFTARALPVNITEDFPLLLLTVGLKIVVTESPPVIVPRPLHYQQRRNIIV